MRELDSHFIVLPLGNIQHAVRHVPYQLDSAGRGLGGCCRWQHSLGVLLDWKENQFAELRLGKFHGHTCATPTSGAYQSRGRPTSPHNPQEFTRDLGIDLGKCGLELSRDGVLEGALGPLKHVNPDQVSCRLLIDCLLPRGTDHLPCMRQSLADLTQ